MSSLADATVMPRPGDAVVRVRSVLPGRQRREVPAPLGGPRAADSMREALSAMPDVEHASAGPIAGRMLTGHAATVTEADADRRPLRVLGVPLHRPAGAATEAADSPTPAVRPGGAAERAGRGLSGGGVRACSLPSPAADPFPVR